MTWKGRNLDASAEASSRETAIPRARGRLRQILIADRAGNSDGLERAAFAAAAAGHSLPWSPCGDSTCRCDRGGAVESRLRIRLTRAACAVRAARLWRPTHLLYDRVAQDASVCRRSPDRPMCASNSGNVAGGAGRNLPHGDRCRATLARFQLACPRISAICSGGRWHARASSWHYMVRGQVRTTFDQRTTYRAVRALMLML